MKKGNQWVREKVGYEEGNQWLRAKVGYEEI